MTAAKGTREYSVLSREMVKILEADAAANAFQKDQLQRATLAVRNANGKRQSTARVWVSGNKRVCDHRDAQRQLGEGMTSPIASPSSSPPPRPRRSVSMEGGITVDPNLDRPIACHPQNESTKS